MIEKLALYQRTYDLYLYSHKFIKKFPKSERFLISHALQEALLEALKLMVRANLERDKVKRRLLQDEIGAWYYIYLTVLRLSRDMNFLPKRKYAHASKLMEEILRILYGWRGKV